MRDRTSDSPPLPIATNARRLARCCPAAAMLLFSSAFCSLGQQGEVHGTAWQISGTLTVIERDRNDRPRTNSTTKFVVTVSSNAWQIKAIFGEGHYSVHGFDGKTICSLLVDEKASAQLMVHMGTGSVREGPVPLDTAHYVLLPWLAYASGPFLCKNAQNGWTEIPAVWLVPLGNPLAHVFKCQTECREGDPSFPTTVKFWPDLAALKLIAKGRHPLVAKLDATSRDRFALMAASYGTNWVGPEAEYEAGGFEQRSGLMLPMRFTFTRFALPPDDLKQRRPGRQRKVFSVFQGVVDTVAKVERFTPLPVPDRPISVGDYRFQAPASSVEFIRYRIEDGHWPSATDPRLLDLFEQRKARQRHLRLPRPIVVLGLVVAFVGPLALWWARRIGLLRRAHSPNV